MPISVQLLTSPSPKLGLTCSVYQGAFAWTLLTLLTPLASQKGYLWMVLIRIGLGLGEGRSIVKVFCGNCLSSYAYSKLHGPHNH